LRIGVLQGRPRAVHLAAHIAPRAALAAEQIAMYDSMRGYGAEPTKHVH